MFIFLICLPSPLINVANQIQGKIRCINFFVWRKLLPVVFFLHVQITGRREIASSTFGVPLPLYLFGWEMPIRYTWSNFSTTKMVQSGSIYHFPKYQVVWKKAMSGPPTRSAFFFYKVLGISQTNKSCKKSISKKKKSVKQSVGLIFVFLPQEAILVKQNSNLFYSYRLDNFRPGTSNACDVTFLIDRHTADDKNIFKAIN